MKPPDSFRSFPITDIRLKLAHGMDVRTNNPGQTCFNRSGVFIEIVPIQTHARLETKTISRPEAGELYRGFRQQLRYFYNMWRRD
jgi:hypothetical protein